MDISGLGLLTLDHSMMLAADGKSEIATMCHVSEHECAKLIVSGNCFEKV